MVLIEVVKGPEKYMAILEASWAGWRILKIVW